MRTVLVAKREDILYFFPTNENVKMWLDARPEGCYIYICPSVELPEEGLDVFVGSDCQIVHTLEADNTLKALQPILNTSPHYILH